MKKTGHILLSLSVAICLCGCGMVDNYADKVSSQLLEEQNANNTALNSDTSIESAKDTDIEKAEENVIESGKESMTNEDNTSGMVIIDKPLKEIFDARSEQQKEMYEINKEVVEKAYQIAYPDAEDLVYDVVVDEQYADQEVIIYIDYSECTSVPDEAVLTVPSGEGYAPCWKNDDLISGLVYWRIKNPDVGTYTIRLSANNKYGQFFTGVLDTYLFSEMYIENTEPHAHPAD